MIPMARRSPFNTRYDAYNKDQTNAVLSLGKNIYEAFLKYSNDDMMYEVNTGNQTADQKQKSAF